MSYRFIIRHWKKIKTFFYAFKVYTGASKHHFYNQLPLCSSKAAPLNLSTPVPKTVSFQPKMRPMLSEACQLPPSYQIAS